MELVETKSESGVKLVVGAIGKMMRLEASAGSGRECESQNPYPVAKPATRVEQPGTENQNPHLWQNRPEVGHPFYGAVIPWIFAAADPCEKWWVRVRGNPKRAGEISQAAFLLKAETMGFDVALPWGDNQKFDFVVWRRDGRTVRVQVKGTGRLYQRGYEVQPVHATRKGGKKRYTKREIDVIAAHVQPVDAWYLIPIEKVGRARSLRLYPGIESRVGRGRSAAGRKRRGAREWERWRERWDVLGG